MQSLRQQQLAPQAAGARPALALRPALSASSMRSRIKVYAQNTVLHTDQGSWVVTPGPDGPAPKAVCHFLGGAFAGAAPQVVYSLFLDTLASAGYTVITTPYAVTFRHLDAAAGVRKQYASTLEELRASPSLFRAVCRDPQGGPGGELLPTFAVGHSMGALLQALTACDEELLQTGGPAMRPIANIIMSINNKQVSDAIPIPGLMDALPTAVTMARAASPSLPLLSMLPSSGDLLRGATALMPPDLRTVLDPHGQISRAALALDQLGSVVNEVGDGTTDFTPTPAQTRSLIRTQYNVQRTLAVRFQDDSIDETPELAEMLRNRMGLEGVTSLVLPGTHLTPCGGDFLGGMASQMGPGGGLEGGLLGGLLQQDATRLVVRALGEQGQADLRRAVARMVEWMDYFAAR